MKFFAYASVLLFAALSACTPTGGAESDVVLGPTSEVTESPREAVLWVNGMGCPLCANNVDQQLMKLEGVEAVRIDLGTGRVFATLDPTSHPTDDDLRKAIEGTGFTLVKIEMH